MAVKMFVTVVMCVSVLLTNILTDANAPCNSVHMKYTYNQLTSAVGVVVMVVVVVVVVVVSVCLCVVRVG